MKEIDSLFPVPLYKTFLNVDLKSIKKHISKIAKQYKLNRNEILNVDTSHNVYDLVKDDFFKPLLNEFLYREDDMTLPPSNPTYFSNRYVQYPCKINQLLIFKSNLNHNTGTKKKGKKTVISFNIGKLTIR